MKQDWEIKKLGDITTSINGLWTGKKPPFITIAVIRNTNFTKDCKLDTSDIAYIDVEVKQYASRKLQCGDIIIEKSGGSDKQPVGRPILFNIEEGEYSFSNFTSTMRVNDKATILPEFVHRYLAYIYARGDTAAMQSKTTGIRNLDFTLYKSIQVPIPPREEQERIVEELDCLSGIIDRKREQLKELDALAQSIFYQMFGDPITNEKGWEVKKLGEVCKTTSGGTPSKGHNEYYEGGTIPWLRSGEVNKMYIYDTELFITEEGLQKSSAKWFPVDTVVIAMYGATVGQVGILKNKMTTNQAICGIFPNKEFTPIYLYHFLLSKKDDYIAMAAGGAQPNISQNIIRDTLVCCPTIAQQQLFAERIDRIEQQKKLISLSIKETEDLFNSRMSYYFN